MSRMAEQQLYMVVIHRPPAVAPSRPSTLPLARCWRPFRLPDARMSTAPSRAHSVGKIWAAMTAMERSRILRRAVDLLRQRNDELARLETLDTGNLSAKPPPSISSPAPTCWSITPD